MEREEFRPHVIHVMSSDPDRIAGPCNPSEMLERNITNAISTRGITVSNAASIRCSSPLAKELKKSTRRTPKIKSQTTTELAFQAEDNDGEMSTRNRFNQIITSPLPSPAQEWERERAVSFSLAPCSPFSPTDSGTGAARVDHDGLTDKQPATLLTVRVITAR